MNYNIISLTIYKIKQYNNYLIQKFDKDVNYLFKFGSFGSKDG